MKICRNLLHLTTALLCTGAFASAQGTGAGRILSLTLDPHRVTTVDLRPGFVTSVRLPEAVSSVVVGDPAGFKAEHSEAEAQLVFFKPITPAPSSTNALITTRTGREVSLTLISRGGSDDSSPVDYVLEYESPRSFLIHASRPGFVIGDTKVIDAATRRANPAPSAENKLLSEERQVRPHWQGKQLRVSVGPMTRNGSDMAVAFSILNSSSKTIELLPPQVQLVGSSNERHSKTVKSEPVPIKDYRLSSRTLAPKARTDGFVSFERPAFKQSSERLMLQVGQVEQVDRPVLVSLSFVPSSQGDAK